MSDILVLVGVIVTGVVSIVTTILTNNSTRKLIAYRLDQVEGRVDDLSKKVETHNNFGIQIAKIETRLQILEGRI